MVRSGARRSSASVSSARPVNDSIWPLRSSLQAHAGRFAPPLARRRADQERQVEARLRRPAVEVEPFGPRVGPGRRVGNAVKPIDLAQHDVRRCVSSMPHRPASRAMPRRAAVSGSSSARSRLGIPPCGRDARRLAAAQEIQVRGVRCRRGANARPAGRRTAACPTAPARAGTARLSWITHVSAADKRRRLRLLEHDARRRQAGWPSRRHRRRNRPRARRCERDARSAIAAPAVRSSRHLALDPAVPHRQHPRARPASA